VQNVFRYLEPLDVAQKCDRWTEGMLINYISRVARMQCEKISSQKEL